VSKTLHVVVLEPYYGGSHAAFVDAVVAGSRHRCRLVSLPARKWKWRMRGAAVWFTRDGGDWLKTGNPCDLILGSDMVSVSDLRASLPLGLRDTPIVCYFHENQLTYPIPDEQDRDYHYGMTNITSCLAADAVWFNSRFHLGDFLAAASRLLDKMPDYVPRDITGEIRRKSSVLPPPVLVKPAKRAPAPADRTLTIVWSHRWEYDKNPEPFFRAMLQLDEAGYAFNLVLLGEQFRTAPAVFADSWERLQRHIVHAGYLDSRQAYLAMLSRCDVVVSTAIQENFGIAVIEAVLAGCQPLLPKRLAYPEIIPPEMHDACLYQDDSELLDRLRDLLNGRGVLDSSAMSGLQASLERRFGPQTTVSALDEAMARVGGTGLA
jgi:glycosyltransferase involved in cell wall biosynthesis